VAVGVAGALAASQLLAGQLFGVTTIDPISYALAAAGLAIVAVATSLIPASRALRVEPGHCTARRVRSAHANGRTRPRAKARRSRRTDTQMTETIKGVLFDVGGVLVALDGMPSLAKWLGNTAPTALHTRWMACPSVVAHETGKVDAATFAAGVVADLQLRITADVFLDDFCRWPQGLLPGARELLDDIPRSCRVAALSNTSAVHWDRIAGMGLGQRLEHAYLSHQTGYLKPAREAFLAALEGMALSPSEVLFLDDGQVNVDAAERLGIHARLVASPEEARAALTQCGVLRPRP
jgi:putative hydrolase of the HAD superfamily